jgi:argininosuccinate synthase
MKKKYVLAYSGGLDTSVILKWLQVNHDVEVVTVTADLGQRREIEGLRRKALAAGASRVFLDDLREEFVSGYVWPSLKAGALYQGVYPLATALGRPLIARRLVEVAREVGADAVVHGCTGKGNDQVRLEVSVAALAPDLACIAPLREWELRTREEEIAWARKHGVPVAATRKSPYSIDENLWGVAIECGVLEDPWAAPPDDCWQITAGPREAPDAAREVTIAFEEGIPVAVDGVAMDGPSLLAHLNEIAGAHGVGRLDVVEDRLVGIKSREVYEAPAAVTLHAAREALEQITLDRETRCLKADLGQQLARLVYDGLWFSPLRASIQAFVDEAVRPVTGEARVALHRGTATVVGRRSPASLYDQRLATYGAGDSFRHGSAAGFIDLFGLGVRTANAAARARAARRPALAAAPTSPRQEAVPGSGARSATRARTEPRPALAAGPTVPRQETVAGSGERSASARTKRRPALAAAPTSPRQEAVAASGERSASARRSDEGMPGELCGEGTRPAARGVGATGDGVLTRGARR